MTRYSTFTKKPKPMRKMSKKREAELDEYDALVTRVRARAKGRCEAELRWPEVRCGGPMVGHHLLGGMGTRKLVCADEDLAWLCERHHSDVHDQPTLAYERGLMKRHNDA